MRWSSVIVIAMNHDKTKSRKKRWRNWGEVRKIWCRQAPRKAIIQTWKNKTAMKEVLLFLLFSSSLKLPVEAAIKYTCFQ